MLPGRRPRSPGRPASASTAAHGARRSAAGRLHALAAAGVRRGSRARRSCRCSATRSRASIDDALHVAAMRTDEDEDWPPRAFAAGELEAVDRGASRARPANRVLAQLGDLRARVRLLHRAERLSRTRRSGAARLAEMQRALRRLHLGARRRGRAILARRRASPTRRRTDESGADRARTISSAFRTASSRSGRAARASRSCARPRSRGRSSASARVAVNGTINFNTNGSLPKSLATADRRRPRRGAHQPELVPAADVRRVLSSDRLRARRRARERASAPRAAGLRVSLNLLTHPGVTDEREEVEAMEAFLRARARRHGSDADAQHRSARLLRAPSAARASRSGCASRWAAFAACGTRVGNFTHTH